MKKFNSSKLTVWAGLGALSAVTACNSVTGLSDFSVQSASERAPECTTNSQCMAQMGAGGDGGTNPAICVQTTGKCVALLSDDCQTVTGDPSDDSAVLIGSLFAIKGATAATNLQRQQSAQLAVQQINQVGGIPASSGMPRKLVMLSCDESTNLAQAAGHLVDLGVPAVVGPNTSQDTLDAANQVLIPGNTVTLTPTGVASSIADLIDDDLSWLMVPTDVQRAPLMIGQINDLETSLKASRSEATIKLGVIFRNDALGIGTRSSLNALTLNGKPISDPINLGKNVQIDGYNIKDTSQDPIVQKYITFAPDIIVLAGTAEAVTQIMVPLEAGWKAANRPQYVLIDSVKVPDLITAVTNNDDLRHRIRGTGITPGIASTPIYNSFKVDYQVAFPGSSPTTSGMGPSYDAAYAIAFALAAEKDLPVTGPNVAKGLRMLAGGATEIDIGATKALEAFQHLAGGDKINAFGTFGPLAWDPNGAVLGGTLEMWCIGANSGTPAYQSSGLTFDIMTQLKSGTYAQCAP